MKRIVYPLILAAILSLALSPGCAEQEVSKQHPSKQDPATPDNPDDPENPDEPDVPSGPIGNRQVSYSAPHYLLVFIRNAEVEARASKSAPEIEVLFNQGTTYSWWSVDAGALSDRTEEYANLCERYGDLGYDQVRTYTDNYAGGYNFLAENIVSIDITSAAAYDEAHPAGISLKDICILRSASPLKYISSGYKETYDWSVIPENFDTERALLYGSDRIGNHPVANRLSDCTPEDFVLLGSGYELFCDLVFTHKPTSGLKQRFLLTFVDEKGKTFTATTDQVQW